MKAKGTYWFGRKRFGFGFGPRSWQGWTTVLVYCVMMIGLPQAVVPAAHHALRVWVMLALTAAFLVVFFLKLDTSKRE